MKEIVTEVLGAAASLASTIAFVPQIAKIRRTGGQDVSFAMLALYITGVSLWLFYGIAIRATALSLANGVSILFTGACLVLKLRAQKRGTALIASKRLRIAIDMDGTIADSLREQIRRYNAEFSETVTPDDLRGRSLEEMVPPDRRYAVRRAVREESFFDSLEVIDGAQEVLRELCVEHDVFVVSAAMEIPVSLAAKHRWLRRHFPFIPERNVVFCGDKSIVDADYLIDDEARHFAAFAGTGLLFSAPHNLSECRYKRIHNWRDIRREFLDPHRCHGLVTEPAENINKQIAAPEETQDETDYVH